MITCSKKYTDIPFAHRQPKHGGHCRFIHGHNWAFEFEFIARELDACGFVIDFGNLKHLKEWLTLNFDHALVLNEDDPIRLLNQFKELCDVLEQKVTVIPDCSCEGLAAYTMAGAQTIVDAITKGRVAVRSVTVWEDERNSTRISL